jgi:glycerate kinase
MRVVVAIDSFKGSVSSLQAGNAAADGIRRADSRAEVTVFPLADGGEGTVNALVEGLHGRYRSAEVTGPVGRPVMSVYGMAEDGSLAVIEMASAAGLALLKETEKDPMHTTSYGVGETIRDAIRNGCRRFIIGIGGSATNDGGAGMLQALGFEFLDADGKEIPPGAEGLQRLQRISCIHKLPALADCEFRVACDVDNPLCGSRGCSMIFGPQKGADLPMAEAMDQCMRRYAAIVHEEFPGADENYPGAGAAGGLGFAFRTFLGASLESGIGIVADALSIEDAIRKADYVVTGEGRLDGQTAMGKAPVGIAKIAAKHGKKVIAFSGAVTPEARVLNERGITAFFPVVRGCISLQDAMETDRTISNLKDTAEQVFRLLI